MGFNPYAKIIATIATNRKQTWFAFIYFIIYSSPLQIIQILCKIQIFDARFDTIYIYVTGVTATVTGRMAAKMLIKHKYRGSRNHEMFIM